MGSPVLNLSIKENDITQMLPLSVTIIKWINMIFFNVLLAKNGSVKAAFNILNFMVKKESGHQRRKKKDGLWNCYSGCPRHYRAKKVLLIRNSWTGKGFSPYFCTRAGSRENMSKNEPYKAGLPKVRPFRATDTLGSPLGGTIASIRWNLPRVRQWL